MSVEIYKLTCKENNEKNSTKYQRTMGNYKRHNICIIGIPEEKVRNILVLVKMAELVNAVLGSPHNHIKIATKLQNNYH